MSLQGWLIARVPESQFNQCPAWISFRIPLLQSVSGCRAIQPHMVSVSSVNLTGCWTAKLAHRFNGSPVCACTALMCGCTTSNNVRKSGNVELSLFLPPFSLTLIISIILLFFLVFDSKNGEASDSPEHHIWKVWEDSRLQPEEVQGDRKSTRLNSSHL